MLLWKQIVVLNCSYKFDTQVTFSVPELKLEYHYRGMKKYPAFKVMCVIFMLTEDMLT